MQRVGHRREFAARPLAVCVLFALGTASWAARRSDEALDRVLAGPGTLEPAEKLRAHFEAVRRARDRERGADVSAPGLERRGARGQGATSDVRRKRPRAAPVTPSRPCQGPITRSRGSSRSTPTSSGSSRSNRKSDHRPRVVTDDLSVTALDKAQVDIVEESLSDDSWDFEEPEGLEEFVDFPQSAWATRPPAESPATFGVIEGRRRSVVRFFFAYGSWPQAEFYAMDDKKHKLMAKPRPIGAHEHGVILEAPIPMEQFTDGHTFQWPDKRVTMTIAEHVDMQLRNFVHIGLGFHEQQSQALGHWLRHRRDISSPDEDEEMGIMQELYLPQDKNRSSEDLSCMMPLSVRTKPFHYYYRPLPSGDVVWYTSLQPFFHDLCQVLRWSP